AYSGRCVPKSVPSAIAPSEKRLLRVRNSRRVSARACSRRISMGKGRGSALRQHPIEVEQYVRNHGPGGEFGDIRACWERLLRAGGQLCGRRGVFAESRQLRIEQLPQSHDL